jgi:alcohol oxidase
VPSGAVTLEPSKDDVELLNFLYKKAREFARRMPSLRGEYPGGHPKFPTTSKAAVQEECQPVPIDAPDLEYDEEDEKAIDAFNRANGENCF